MRRLRFTTLLALWLLCCAGVVWARDVGSVAEVQGTVEVGQAGAWAPAAIGGPVRLHDELRTGADGRILIVFQDGSVLVVGVSSSIVIDEQTFDPEQGLFRSGIRLLQGKLRTIVSEYYQRPGSEYRIETVTAVSGVRGTEFVITFDPVAEVADVVGVEGTAVAHSVLDRTGRGALVTAQELTRVAKGKFPTKPQRLDEPTFRQYLEGLEFIGNGGPESMTRNSAILMGADVPVPYRPDAFPPPLAQRYTLPEFREPDAPPESPAVLSGPGDLTVRL